MKRLLARINPNKTIGLYVNEGLVSGSLVSGTPFGAVELAHHAAVYEPDQLAEAIQCVLRELGVRKPRAYPAMLGLASGRVFFSSRPMKTESTDASPQVLLHEALQSSGLSVDDMVVESFKSQPGKRPVVSLVSCRKKYLTGLLAAAQQSGMRSPRVEPAMCALLRAGAYRQNASRVKPVIRLFLGEKKCMGMVAVGNSPLIWRHFDLSAADKLKGIGAAVRTLQTLAKPCGVDLEIEVLVIHGQAIERRQLENKEFLALVGIPVVWCDGPDLEDSAIAFGLALGGLNPTSEVLDLARSFKPLPMLRDIFPWKEVVLQILLLGGMALFLYDRSATLHDSYLKVQFENRKYPWAESVANAELDKEKKDLERKVDAFRSFLGTRALWSKYTADICDTLPANITLSSMQGMYELESAGKGAAISLPKRTFILRAFAPLTADGAVPPEIDAFLISLRHQPLLQRDFPNIELSDIKSMRSTESKMSKATFTIVCLPKAQPIVAAKLPGKAKSSTGQ